MYRMRLNSPLLFAVVLTAGVGLGYALWGTSKNPPPAETTPVASPQKTPDTKPHWQELSASQKNALAPLAQLWPSMTEAHKRKWLALSHNFSQLSEPDQSTLQGRMREWAALSAQQRAQARLNFAGAQKLPQDERRMKWEAYQALSAEEKQKLAAQQPVVKAGTALASKPVSPEKLASPPSASTNKALPRIATDQAAPITLLPIAAVTPQSTAVPDAEVESTISEQ